jgi:hypothetical protein
MLSRHWNQFGLAPENVTTLLISARMAAAVYGLDDQLEFASGHGLGEASARQIYQRHENPIDAMCPSGCGPDLIVVVLRIMCVCF